MMVGRACYDEARWKPVVKNTFTIVINAQNVCYGSMENDEEWIFCLIIALQAYIANIP